MWSIYSLLLLPGPLSFRVVVPVSVLFMGQKDMLKNPFKKQLRKNISMNVQRTSFPDLR